MPIYAYRCEECGYTKDVLQKMSDPQLTVCLSCGKPSFKKQLTAAGFQLKGTGWYATDFRGGTPPATGVSTGPAENAPKTDGAKSDAPKSDSPKSDSSKSDSSKSDAPKSAGPASGAASSGGTGST